MTNDEENVWVEKGAAVFGERGAGVWQVAEGAQPMASSPMPSAAPTGNSAASDSGSGSSE